jgi:hypothetical protein
MTGPLVLVIAISWMVLAWHLLRKSSVGSVTIVAEYACLMLVECAGLFSTWPYLHAGLVGAGDIYHYALQMGDAVTQARHGVFPLLVGQSAYAFNGNIHTIRTAPYYVHLGVVIDAMTGRKLPFPALENLTITLSTLIGGLSAYYAARRLASGCRLASALLACIYVTGAGLLTPIYHYDMLGTLLIAPWQPIFWLGIMLSLQNLRDWEGLALSTIAVSVLWYAHPPTAGWLSPVLVACQLLRLALVGRASGNLWRPLAGIAAAAALTGYEFYSVHSLHLAYSLSTGGAMPAEILENLRAAWPGSVLLPIARATSAFSDLQLGYVLWIVLIAATLSNFRASLAGAFLGAISLVYVILVLPVPGVTLAIWKLIPAALLDATNVWPMQRFYPILEAVATISGALAIGRLALKRAGSYGIVCGFLGTAFLWNLGETWALQRRALEQTFDEATSEKMLDPRNVTLTRSSYLLFGNFPPYFSHGHTDPAFELRILDSSQAIVADNTAAILRSYSSPAASEIRIRASPYGEMTTDGIHDYLLDFQLPAGVAGSVVVRSNSVDLSYFLPESGGPLAFGSGPRSSRTLPIRTAGRPIESVEVGASPPNVSVVAIPFLSDSLPLKLESMIPLVATIDAPGPGYLETPRVFIPGYRATVNDSPARIVRSAAGLVAVPIAAGHQRVVIDYPGGMKLRGFYFISLASLIAALVGVAWLIVRSLDEGGSAEPINSIAIARYRLFAPRP